MAESSSWSRASTPVAGAVFVVSATTGVLLFFHLGERLIKDLHEWVGVAFVAAAILHVLRNRHALAAHARRPTLWVALAAALVTAAAEDSATGGPDPARGIWPVIATIDASGFTRLDDAELASRFAALTAGGDA